MNPVSIHAPVLGATAIKTPNVTTYGGFNPRPRAGGDAFSMIAKVEVEHVSIHAPVLGATATAITKSFLCIFKTKLRSHNFIASHIFVFIFQR